MTKAQPCTYATHGANTGRSPSPSPFMVVPIKVIQLNTSRNVMKNAVLSAVLPVFFFFFVLFLFFWFEPPLLAKSALLNHVTNANTGWANVATTCDPYCAIWSVMMVNKSSSSVISGTHISVKRFRSAGESSFLPKSPPGFIVAKIRKSGWATISSTTSPPFSANVKVRPGSNTLFNRNKSVSLDPTRNCIQTYNKKIKIHVRIHSTT